MNDGGLLQRFVGTQSNQPGGCGGRAKQSWTGWRAVGISGFVFLDVSGLDVLGLDVSSWTHLSCIHLSGVVYSPCLELWGFIGGSRGSRREIFISVNSVTSLLVLRLQETAGSWDRGEAMGGWERRDEEREGEGG